MFSLRAVLAPTLLLAMALGLSTTGTAGETTFNLKTSSSGVVIGWGKDCTDGSKVEFFEGNATSTPDFISRGGSRTGSTVLLGARNQTYKCKISGYTTGYNINLVLQASRNGGRIEGAEILNLKLGLLDKKPKLTVTHVSGPAVAKLVDGDTLEIQ